MAGQTRWPPSAQIRASKLRRLSCNNLFIYLFSFTYLFIHLVIAGHENIYVNSPSPNRGKTVGEVSMWLSRRDASTDIWPAWVIYQVRSFDLTKVTFSNWPSGVKMHMFPCVLTRGIRWCFAFFSISLISKVVFAKKLVFPKKQLYFVWAALGRSKCDPR